MAKQNEVWILSDLAYAEIYFGDTPPPSILQVPGAKSSQLNLHRCQKHSACQVGEWDLLWERDTNSSIREN